jgi:MFS transporter, OFA family, oxalate/formate antiporter
MTPPLQKGVPGRAWVVVFAGTIVNLCLGILYAWSVWKQALVYPDERMVQEMAGVAMTGINEGWRYLNNAQASTPFSLAVMIFALSMIPGGRIHDRFGPRFGATVGGSAWRPDASSRG